MAYSTIEVLLTIIPQKELCNLTNDSNLSTEINTDVVQSAIEYADELINSYLRNKYKLPLMYVPKIIEKISSDITAYRLYSRRPHKMPEHIENNYKEEMILDLPAEHENENITNSAKMVVSNTTKQSKKFNDETWRQFGL